MKPWLVAKARASAEGGYTGAAVRVADILAKRGLQLAPLPEPAAEPQGSGYGLY